MNKLSSLARPENYFYTTDGATLKTTHDLFSYFSSCSPANYMFHANDKKNDFANWVRYVLILPDLADKLVDAKNIPDARSTLIEFFREFEVYNSRIPENNYFHTFDGYTLKNALELYYYVNNSGYESYIRHASPERNDFANWISDVLKFPELASKLKDTKSREEFITVLKDFLMDAKSYMKNSPEFADMMKKHPELTMKNPDGSQPKMIVDIDLEPKLENKIIQSGTIDIANNSSPSTKPQAGDVALPENTAALKKDDAPAAGNMPEPTISASGFRQFTDEELEKFSKFGKVEKNNDVDPKVEYLKSAYLELKNLVKELRRAEKDPYVADLLLRTLTPKIDYYALSKNQEDYDKIVQIMKEIQKEIEYCSTQNRINLADDIIKALEIERIVLKKT